VMQHARDMLLGSQSVPGKPPRVDVRLTDLPFFSLNIYFLGLLLYNLCSTRKLVPFLNGRQYILVLYAPDITNEFPSSLADIFPDCVIYCTIARSVSSSIHFR
jgi:hypothetical protein